ncbi:MAG: adenylyl-sulfate kinase [Candidatus Thioglobus sp.]|nr:adenylyl-sulfate kinase [Candidatus Thioglobus sp.]
MPKNIIHHNAFVTRDRRNQLNGHKSVVLWFTGLSGSGKSTLAHSLEAKIHQLGGATFVLDGDNVRYGLSADLGFSAADRTENIRRISAVAKIMLEAGIIVMTAFISPLEAHRNMARGLFADADFIEIYCKASLEICEKRDTKGLYKKARAGEIKNYTGINSPYEIPVNPELIINTELEDLDNSVLKIIKFLQNKNIFDAK